jgi:hypothetical protein
MQPLSVLELDGTGGLREAPNRNRRGVPEGSSLTLPTADRTEDFVEGSLCWESPEVLIYYETTLSYLSLWSAERDPVEEFRAFRDVSQCPRRGGMRT